ncbi:MAG: hypothetical protein V3S30_08625 [Thermoanaerobaculia bacterium]
MKRLMILATLWVVPAVVLGQDSQGPLQSMAMKVGETRRFLQDQGHGDVLPLAQATFRRVGAETLCVDLGLKRGPGALSDTFLTFTRITTIEGKHVADHFNVTYDKKSRIKEKDFIVQSGCTSIPMRNPHAEQDRVQVRVRRPGRKPEVFYINYPGPGARFAMNIFSHSNGTLSAQNVVMASNESNDLDEETEDSEEKLFFIGEDSQG